MKDLAGLFMNDTFGVARLTTVAFKELETQKKKKKQRRRLVFLSDRCFIVCEVKAQPPDFF